MHVKIRHLRAEVDGDAVVVASSASKQLKTSYFRRWSRFNNRTEKGLGYNTRRYAGQTVGTYSLPITTALVIQDRGISVYSYFEKGCWKNVHATIPKGNMGDNQYTVSDDYTRRTYFCCLPLALANTFPRDFRTNSFKCL